MLLRCGRSCRGEGGTIALVPDRQLPVPQWTASARELDDLDLLVKGCFEPPLSGFVDPTTSPDAAPVTLVVSDETAELALAAGSLDLIDPEGAPLARLRVTSKWDAGAGRAGIAGPVTGLAHNEFGPFRRLHQSPAQVHEKHPKQSLLAVPVTAPPTLRQIGAISAQAEVRSLVPLLLACVGDGMPQGVSGPALIRSALAAVPLVGHDAAVVAVSVADHDDSRPTGGQSPNDWLLNSVAQAFADDVLQIDPDPAGSYPPSIEAIVSRDRPARDQQGAVIFFTGLSGSGKSTLARGLIDVILERGERTITSLDGDVVRHHLSKGLGFSREDRETNILRIGFVAAEIARHGGLAVCSPIAPFESTRQQVRQMVERAGGGFILVHVATPLEECERRDRKGLYAKARAGEILDFTGISSPYEEPVEALKVDTTNRDIAECVADLLKAIAADGWLRP